MAKKNEEFKYEVLEKIGVISKKNGWTKELRVVAFNDNEPKYDIRDWSEDGKRMGKGATLTFEELQELYTILEKVLKG
jgi:hypothetical protein